jgi:hypothetical protein
MKLGGVSASGSVNTMALVHSAASTAHRRCSTLIIRLRSLQG